MAAIYNDDERSFRDKTLDLFGHIAVFGGLGYGVKKAFSNETVIEKFKAIKKNPSEMITRQTNRIATRMMNAEQNNISSIPMAYQKSKLIDKRTSITQTTMDGIDSIRERMKVAGTETKESIKNMMQSIQLIRKGSAYSSLDELYKSAKYSERSILEMRKMLRRRLDFGESVTENFMQWTLRNKKNPKLIEEVSSLISSMSTRIARESDIVGIATSSITDSGKFFNSMTLNIDSDANKKTKLYEYDLHIFGDKTNYTKKLNINELNNRSFLHLTDIQNEITSRKSISVIEMNRKTGTGELFKEPVGEIYGLVASRTNKFNKSISMISLEFREQNNKSFVNGLFLADSNGVVRNSRSEYVVRNIAIAEKNGKIRYMSYNDYAIQKYNETFRGLINENGEIDLHDLIQAEKDIDKQLSKARTYIGNISGKESEQLSGQALLHRETYVDIEGNLSTEMKDLAKRKKNITIISATPSAFNKGNYFHPSSSIGTQLLDTAVNPNSYKVFRSSNVIITDPKTKKILSPTFSIGHHELQEKLFEQKLVNMSQERAKIFNETAAKINQDITNNILVTGSLAEDQQIANETIMQNLHIATPYKSKELEIMPIITKTSNNEKMISKGTKLLKANGSIETLETDIIVTGTERINGRITIHGRQMLTGAEEGAKFFGEHGMKTLVSGSGTDSSLHTILGLTYDDKLRNKYINLLEKEKQQLNTPTITANEEMFKTQLSESIKRKASMHEILLQAEKISRKRFGDISGIGYDLVKSGARRESFMIQKLIEQYGTFVKNKKIGQAEELKMALENVGVKVKYTRRKLNVKLIKGFNAAEAMKKIRKTPIAGVNYEQEGLDTVINLRSGAMDVNMLRGQRATFNQDTKLLLRLFGENKLINELSKSTVINREEGEIFRYMHSLINNKFDKDAAISSSDISEKLLDKAFGYGRTDADNTIFDMINARKEIIAIAENKGKLPVLYLEKTGTLIPLNILNPNHIKTILKSDITDRLEHPDSWLRVAEEHLPAIEKETRNLYKLSKYTNVSFDDMKAAEEKLLESYTRIFTGDNNVNKLIMMSKPLNSSALVGHTIPASTLKEFGIDVDVSKTFIVSPETFKRMGIGREGKEAYTLVARYPTLGPSSIQVGKIFAVSEEEAKAMGIKNNAFYSINTDGGKVGSSSLVRAMQGDWDGDIYNFMFLNIKNEVDAKRLANKLNLINEFSVNMNDIVNKSISGNIMETRLAEGGERAVIANIAAREGEKKLVGPLTNIINFFKLSATEAAGKQANITDLVSLQLLAVFGEASIKAKKNLPDTNEIETALEKLRILIRGHSQAIKDGVSIDVLQSQYSTHLNDLLKTIIGGGATDSIQKEKYSEFGDKVVEELDKVILNVKNNSFAKNEIESLVTLRDNIKEKGILAISDLLGMRAATASELTVNASAQMSKRMSDLHNVVEEMVGQRWGITSRILENSVFSRIGDFLREAKTPIFAYTGLGVAAAVGMNMAFRDRHTDEQSYTLPDAAKGAEEINADLMNSAQTIHVGAADFEEQLEAKLDAPVGVEFIKREVTSSLEGTDSIVYIKDLRKDGKYRY